MLPATMLSSTRWLSILCPAWRDRNKCCGELHQLLDEILKKSAETTLQLSHCCSTDAKVQFLNTITYKLSHWIYQHSDFLTFHRLAGWFGKEGTVNPLQFHPLPRTQTPSTRPACSASNFPLPNEQLEASMAQKDKFYGSWSLTDTAQVPSSSVNQQKASMSDLLKHFQVSSK